MKDNQLLNLSKTFAVSIVNLDAEIKRRGKANAIVSQLLRSGTSVGANVHEANYAQSKADFISKLQIALKECYETDYWLDLFQATDIITQEEFDTMSAQCNKIHRLLIASIKTAKENI